MINKTYIARVVDAAIRNEEKGERFYEAMSEKFGSNKELGDLFLTLAGDEEKHKRSFEAMRDEWLDSVYDPAIQDDFEFAGPKEAETFFDGESLESREEASFFGVEFIESKEDALVQALKFEKSSLQYYEGMLKLLGESPVLRKLINEEKMHVREVTRSILNTGSLYKGMDFWDFEYRFM